MIALPQSVAETMELEGGEEVELTVISMNEFRVVIEVKKVEHNSND